MGKRRSSSRGKSQPPIAEDQGAAENAPSGPKGTPNLGDSTPPAVSFPIVGIGASAGGLAAFEAFFSGMPAGFSPNMAFVLVQHLAPDHKSILAELISRHTSMQVFEAEDGMEVRPNCAYIMPPGHDMALRDGALRLFKPSVRQGRRLSVDSFFCSLARERGERAICIVLSGAGSDGTQGLRAVKAEGGMAMAQTPDSAECDGMPRSAVSTGLVDYELPPSQMPAQLIAYASAAFGNPGHDVPVLSRSDENALLRILKLLRAQNGHDFHRYKQNTIRRRIERRMIICRTDTMEKYAEYLQRMPDESKALFRDLLIGVTGFFRDAEAFRALGGLVIPRLFEGKPEGSTIRVWSPGCSIGEEAYSLAILLREHLEELRRNYTVQVFASDIDSQAIATARAGLYPASIAGDLSPERLSRFFAPEAGGNAYRIHKVIRDMLVFSEHDVLRDPPFSKLDLISCRNLLIYLSADLQDKLLPLFHYALRPGGFLFLGSSETIGASGDLFAELDQKAKLYQRRETPRGALGSSIGNFPASMTASEEALEPAGGKIASPPPRPTLQELAEQTILQRVAPAAALVDSHGDILYLHGHTGLFLEPAPGVAGVSNILKMAREGLQSDLAFALRKALAARAAVRCPGLRVRTNGEFSVINLSVFPVPVGPDLPAADLCLVVLEEAPPSDLADTDRSAEAGERIEAINQELHAKEKYLQTSNEELISSNEEMQSINEELRSTNEELETSQEELQSVNEELTTVNAELQLKVAELSRANNDINNLLAGTGIGTLFVDRELRILRFTPAVARIINLLAADIGRPLANIATTIATYDRLVEDTQAVLDALTPKELDVETKDGRWYTMRILPYRTLDSSIEGAVINFIDITETKQARDALSVSEIRYRRLFETAKDGILILDAETGKIANVNPFLAEMLGYSQEQLSGKAIWDIGLFRDVAANREHFQRLQQQQYIRYEDLPLETADGRQIEVEFISNVYTVDHRKVIQCDIRDITDRKRAENEIKKLVDEKELLLKEVHHRIKNNMNIIKSLLSIQAATLKDASAIAALEDAGSRVQSMMMLYEKLYQSVSYSAISVKEYLPPLVDEILANFPNSKDVKVEKAIDDFILDIGRLQPLGIIINELLTNIMKYAFIGRDDGLIKISISSEASAITLVLQDNGNGMPESVDFKGSTGFGLQLVEMLTKQLGGSIRIERDKGTRIILVF